VDFDTPVFTPTLTGGVVSQGSARLLRDSHQSEWLHPFSRIRYMATLTARFWPNSQLKVTIFGPNVISVASDHEEHIVGVFEFATESVDLPAGVLRHFCEVKDKLCSIFELQINRLSKRR
jgi:hypothetical protein